MDEKKENVRSGYVLDGPCDLDQSYSRLVLEELQRNGTLDITRASTCPDANMSLGNDPQQGNGELAKIVVRLWNEFHVLQAIRHKGH